VRLRVQLRCHLGGEGFKETQQPLQEVALKTQRDARGGVPEVPGGVAHWQTQRCADSWQGRGEAVLSRSRLSRGLEGLACECTLQCLCGVQVDFCLLAMIKPHQAFLNRKVEEGLYFQYSTSEHQIKLHSKLHRLQVDGATDLLYDYHLAMCCCVYFVCPAMLLLCCRLTASYLQYSSRLSSLQCPHPSLS
jgi:hypothetical protein